MDFLANLLSTGATGAAAGGVAGGADAAGAGGGFADLINNKLFLQMLSAAGQDIGSGNPIGTNVNAVTQQNISSQNFMKLLQKMMAGNVPEGGKISMDNKGMKIDIPQSSMSMGGNSGMFLGPNPLGTTNPMGTPTQTPQQSNLQAINPFVGSQSGITASDLAGLSPADLTSIFHTAISVEDLKRKRASDIVDMMYKGALTEKAMRPEPLDQPYPIEVPGVGKVSARQWNALPNSDKEYAIYVHGAKKLGDGDIMSKSEWKMVEPSERERFTRAVMSDPKLMRAAKELAASGATRISLGEKLTEKKEVAKLGGQLYFKDPKWIDDLSKHIKSEDVQNQIMQAEGSSAQNKVRAKESIRFIESKISAGGGTVADVKISNDKKTMTWTVKWPSGDTETINYDIGR